MPNWFNRPLPMPKVKRSYFEEDNNFKTSTNLGLLTPVYVEECLPGDKFTKLSVNAFCRFAPLKLPVMHNISIHQSTFFVPIRIILGEELYKKFLNNEVEIQPVVLETGPLEPAEGQTAADFFRNSIFDFLGYDPLLAKYKETTIGDQTTISAKLPIFNPIPWLAYLSIVQNWYLDSNIEDERIQAIDYLIQNYRESVEAGEVFFTDFSGYGYSSLSAVFNVAYSKDYFSTARPQPQKGSDMYVLNRPLTLAGTPGKDFSAWDTGLSQEPQDYDDPKSKVNLQGYYMDSDTDTYGVNLSEETTIRDLWRKEMLQRFFEVDNTFGTRIREKLAGHFGVRFPDESIQIPRILSTSRSTTKIQEVIQTSESSDEAYLGSYAGRATAADSNRVRPYYCVEHGFVLSLISFVPANGYVIGSPRWAFKRNFFDFASPEFNNIGWQDVFKGEIGIDPNYTDLDTDAQVLAALEEVKGTWAYQPRYSEYRSHVSRVAGNFRNAAELAWHLNRNFEDTPALNGEFLRVADTDRIFAGSSGDPMEMPLYLDVTIRSGMYRPISYEPDSMHLY